MQGGVQGSVLYLEHVFGTMLNGVCNRMPMYRTKQEGAENKHVEGALQKLDLV
jgi:hypothetical protein